MKLNFRTFFLTSSLLLTALAHSEETYNAEIQTSICEPNSGAISYDPVKSAQIWMALSKKLNGAFGNAQPIETGFQFHYDLPSKNNFYSNGFGLKLKSSYVAKTGAYSVKSSIKFPGARKLNEVADTYVNSFGYLTKIAREFNLDASSLDILAKDNKKVLVNPLLPENEKDAAYFAGLYVASMESERLAVNLDSNWFLNHFKKDATFSNIQSCANEESCPFSGVQRAFLHKLASSKAYNIPLKALKFFIEGASKKMGEQYAPAGDQYLQPFGQVSYQKLVWYLRPSQYDAVDAVSRTAFEIHLEKWTNPRLGANGASIFEISLKAKNVFEDSKIHPLTNWFFGKLQTLDVGRCEQRTSTSAFASMHLKKLKP